MSKPFPNEVYLNGQWVLHDKAFISVFDRGYLLGDGIYEVIPFYKGRPFTLQDHLDRMQNGLNEIEIAFQVDALKPVILEAVDRSPLRKAEAGVYIQVTRGVAPRTHYFPDQSTPTVLLYVYPIEIEGFEHKRAKVIFSDDIRWHRCDIKSISLMANVKANNDAHVRGASENLFIRDGLITEGTHASVFFVRDNIVYTHPSGPHILPGITRKIVIDICRQRGFELRQEAVHINDLDKVDEAFLTGTTTQVLAITDLELNGREMSLGKEPGPITKSLQEAFINQVKAC